MRGTEMTDAAARPVEHGTIAVLAPLRAAWLALWSFASRGARATRPRASLAASDLRAAFERALRGAVRPISVIVLEPAITSGDEAATRARIEWACLGASRPQDLVGRTDEDLRYAVVLPETEERTARFVAGRIARVLSADPTCVIEIAFGVAEVLPARAATADATAVLDAATRALFRTRVGGGAGACAHRASPRRMPLASARPVS